MTAYYNEYDKYAAEWLCNLIAAGHIAPGVVDTRSIEDVHPADLQDFTQCHFFAGIGVWSLALRRAGWPDDRPVWTGSCPCQPFSAAGQGAGFADERHLWPAFHHLIRQRRPAVVLGEQVASKDADPWIDLVQDDMEGVGYRFGAIPFPSAGVGAPHIRDRLYWVADANNGGRLGRRAGQARDGRDAARLELERLRDAGGLANAHSGVGGQGCADVRGRADGGDAQPWPGSGGSRVSDGLANAGSERCDGQRLHVQPGQQGPASAEAGRGIEVGRLGDANDSGSQGRPEGSQGEGAAIALPGEYLRPGPTNGYWRAADWLGCRDGKWRPVEASPQPLVDGSAESLGRVRPEVITQIEEEVNAATAQTEGGRAAAMRALLEGLRAQAKCGWPAGGLPGLHEAPFLLAFVRQLQEQGWRIAEGVALPRAEATSGVLRSVWHDQATSGASRRRELDEQRSGEPADVVCVLSRILARHASTAWDDAYAAHAEIGFPIGHGSRSRVGRLRGYGNAINAEAARVFIEALMECQP